LVCFTILQPMNIKVRGLKLELKGDDSPAGEGGGEGGAGPLPSYRKIFLA